MTVSNKNGLRRSPLAAALLVALLVPMAGTAMAQDATDDGDTTPGAASIDRVSVVGSRIKRAEIEGPAPITVISREQIDREGFQTVGDMLQTLTQNTTSSFTGDLAVAGFSPNAQVANLRNLGPGYTLTLVNGRRPAQYPQPYNRDNNVVNIKAIPASIIERVEILTGGASAIYGSDAVAGVINIVTRTNFEGNELRLNVGTTSNGGGDNVKVEYTGGRTGDRWNAVWALQYGDREPVFASQRDFLSDTRNGPLGRVTNPALSLIAIRGNTVPGRGNANTNAFYPGAAVCDRFGYTTVTTAARGQYCGAFTQPGSRSISNKEQMYSAYGSGDFDITDNLQLFGVATFYSTDASSSSGTEFWSTSNDRLNITSTGGTSPLYYDPSFGGLIQLQRVFNPFELGGSEAAATQYDERTFDVTAGLRGTLADRFDWETSVQRSEYNYTANRPRLLAKAVHDYFLGPRLGFSNATGTGPGIYPIYNLNRQNWVTPLTPEQYQALSTRVINEGDTASTSINLSMTGDLFDLPAGPLGFAAVMEGVRQEVDLRSDPRTDPLRPADEQTIYNLVSSGRTEGTRDRYAAGIEFRAPIFSTLEATLAGRYDKYDDITSVDDALTYNLGLEWRPFDSLLLRASKATSFRAPDMQFVYAQGAASFAGALDEYSCRSGTGPGAAQGPRTRTQCNVTGDPTFYTVQTRIAGNPLLEEERGTSWGAGFVWDIVDNMSLTVDYYKIRLADATAQLGSDYILRSEAACRLGTYADGSPAPAPAFCDNIIGLINRTVAPGTTLDGRVESINDAYINTALQETTGVDASFKYRLDTDRLGTFMTNLGYTIVMTNKYQLVDGTDLVDYRDLAPEFFYPERSRARGSVTWALGDWTTTVFGTRYGSAFTNATTPGVNTAGGVYGKRLPPWMLYNLSLGKRFGDSVRVDLTVVNVLDNQRREDNSFTAYPYYDYAIGADPLGRRFNLSLQYKF